ncbi:hypothetical protein L596_017133 [Steinernema carpocapsae]|uniref:Uncharacterized protein n=1 Tax=Steinernema carpocapsae TaxID=34508 RepID=A0A4U5N0Q5_STECR|nr:hypothetical protein L596_017133 [Steinernema carpocapsae]
METTLQSITVSSSLTVITSVDSPSDVVANTKVAEKVAGVLANENGKLLNEVREKLNFLDDAAEWQNEVLGEVENWTKIWDSRIGKILINRHDATLAENAMVIANLTESIEYARNFVYLKRNWMKEAVRSTQFEKCRHYVESLLSNGSDSEALSSVHSQRPTDYVIRRGAPILQSKEELSRGLQGPRQELTVLREAKIKGQASLARLVKWEEDLQNAGLRVKQAIADRKTEINELEHHLIAATYVLDQMRYYK